MKNALNLIAIITLPVWFIPLLIISVLLMCARLFATAVLGERTANWMFAYFPD